MEHTAEEGIAFLPFFPLALGDLARPGSAIVSIAADLDATPSQLTLAWLLHRAPNVLPIPGTTSLSHLEQNIRAEQISLSN